MLPNVKSAVLKWAKDLTITNITVNKDSDFNKTNVPTTRIVKATVQPADPKKLNPDIVDFSLEYMMVHSDSLIFIGEFFTHLGTQYKVIDTKDYQEYGYKQAIGEQVRVSL